MDKRIAWLATLKANQIYLTRDGDHACNYMTAAAWIDEHQEDFNDTPAEAIQAMKDTNTIWSLQIYPDTPIGSYSWYRATMFDVIGAALEFFNSADSTTGVPK